jgi:hypothetical protein
VTAKPHRDAPERTRTYYARILALLRERGPVGVLASELYDAPRRYGRSPRNRISELRLDGHRIEGNPRGSSDWHYVLTREAAPAAASSTAAESSDWYERQTGKPRPHTPPDSLFLWERRQ